MSQHKKSHAKRINNQEFVYVVASDIAARGIDIEGVSHVINIDYPIKLDSFCIVLEDRKNGE